MTHQQDEENMARLRAMLEEDTGSIEEAADLLEIAAYLNTWPAPEPSEQDTTRLIDALLPVLPVHQTRLDRVRRRLANWWPLLILRAQIRIVRGEIWVASALIIALGILVTLATYDTTTDAMLPLVLVAPLVAAVGVAFLYGPEIDPALEIQLATPTSPRLVLLARLVLLFGFDLSLGLAGSITLTILQTDVSLWPLVMAWLAPMTFLSALAFLLSVAFKDPLVGVIVSIGLWSLQAFLRLADFNSLPLTIPDLTGEAARPWLWAAGLVMGIVALWLAGREEQWTQGWNNYQ